MKRERIFYLDFIRVVAVITILLTHYNALFLYLNPQQLNKVVITYKVCNLYIGDFGVSLFFIISGAALMYVYGEKCKIKKFYWKRLISIYPMFWICYIGAFIYRYVSGGWYGQGVPKVNFIYTLLGFDGYFASTKPTFYLVGEWFLGSIIIIYLLFPILRAAMNKSSIATLGCLALIFLLGIACYQTASPKCILPGVRLLEFGFGMFFIKYFKKVKWPVALVCLAILVANTVFAPAIDSNVQTLYVGIAAFIVLVFISNLIKCKFLEIACSVIGKYSYAVFLCHHFIILTIMAKFDLYNMKVRTSYAMFVICCAIIAVISVALYWINEGVVKGSGFIRGRLKQKKGK